MQIQTSTKALIVRIFIFNNFSCQRKKKKKKEAYQVVPKSHNNSYHKVSLNKIFSLFNFNITPILLRKNKSLGQRTDMQIYLMEKNPSSDSDFKPCQNGSGIIMQTALTQTRTERTSKAIPLMYFQIV